MLHVPMTNYNAEGIGQDADPRLMQWYNSFSAWSKLAARLIVALHDHKGHLYIAWIFEPSLPMVAMARQIWEDECMEDGDNVSNTWPAKWEGDTDHMTLMEMAHDRRKI